MNYAEVVELYYQKHNALGFPSVGKLSGMPYAKAEVHVFKDGTVFLKSYNTFVVVKYNDLILCTGTYSATTRKHISSFMHEFTNRDYYFCKEIAGTGNWKSIND